ncbi:MAG: hypothetical protein EHM36_09620 [Deltaproteobacteria bacterium]|jgi:hypothetical protein|nr:MAG: hypothetical protein EHM36_09620 [Deltaproteobacteria bacterium]
MKDQNEIQLALEIWNLTNKLSDLLWDRYEKEFLEIYLKEEEDKFLRTIKHATPSEDQDKTEE